MHPLQLYKALQYMMPETSDNWACPAPVADLLKAFWSGVDGVGRWLIMSPKTAGKKGQVCGPGQTAY
eukprot:scaffold627_cov22-Tisochrysis_lutea.AAC.2